MVIWKRICGFLARSTAWVSDRAGRITIKIRIKTPPVVQPKAQKRLEKIGAPKSLAVSDAALLIGPIVIACDQARVGIAEANETKATLNVEP